MGWKEWPSWVKGSILGFILSSVFSIKYIIDGLSEGAGIDNVPLIGLLIGFGFIFLSRGLPYIIIGGFLGYIADKRIRGASNKKVSYYVICWSISGFILGIILNVLAILSVSQNPESWAFFILNVPVMPLIAFALLILKFIGLGDLDEMFIVPLLGIIGYTIIGAILGWIIGRIKSKKPEKNKVFLDPKNPKDFLGR